MIEPFGADDEGTRWRAALELGSRLGVIPAARVAPAREAVDAALGAELTPALVSNRSGVPSQVLKGLLLLARVAAPGGPAPSEAELASIAESVGVPVQSITGLFPEGVRELADGLLEPSTPEAQPTPRLTPADRTPLAAEPTLKIDPHDASPSALPTAPASEAHGARPNIPSRLGPYEVLDELGHGGMGVVYRARHVSLGTTCAIKVLIAGEHASPEAIARFQREAGAVARMGKHPNIVTVHDLGQEGAIAYYAMDLVEGTSLARRMQERGFTPIEAASLLEKVSRAIHFAHSNGIIHRDLKPDNIVVRTDGEPQVMDFGLARDVRSEEKLSQTGQVMGTPAYMAPEQARGVVGGIDARTDVYALGAVLYELLTAIPPHRGHSLADLLVRVMRGDIVAPRRIRPDLPRDVETVCTKALSTDPRGRYATAEALADDLARFARGEPVAARPVGPVGRAVRLVRRRPRASALVSGMICLALGLSWRLIGPARIALSTDPPDARVEAVGRTMWRGWVWPAESFDLQVSAVGRETRRVHADVSAGATTRLGVISLDLDHGFLALDSQPPGAEVLLDSGPALARTPVGDLQVPNGDHTLTLRLPEHVEYAAAITIRPGGSLHLGTVHLQHLTGELRLTGNPRGMEILVRPLEGDRVVARVTPPRTLPMDTGAYRLEGDAADSLPRSLKVLVGRDLPTSVNFWLPRRTIWSTPWLKDVDEPMALGDLDGDGVLEVVCVAGSSVFAFPGRGSSALWAVSTGDAGVGPPALADMNRDGVLDVVAGTFDGRLLAISGRGGGLVWERSTGPKAPVLTRPALADLDGDGACDAVVGCGDGGAYAFSGRDGGVLWTVHTGGKVSSWPLVTDLQGDGRLACVIASEDGTVHAVSGDRGTPIWTLPTKGAISATPALADLDRDGVTDVMVGSHDHHVHAMAGRGGTELWARDIGDEATSLVALGDLDGDGTPDLVSTTGTGWVEGAVICLSGRDGRDLWRTVVAAKPQVCEHARDLDGDGTVDLFVATEGEVIALGGRDGRRLWGFPCAGDLAAGVVLGGVAAGIAVGDVEGDGEVDCLVSCGLEARNGSQIRSLAAALGRFLWTSQLPGRVSSPPALADLDADGVPDCVVGGGDGRLRALSGRDGFELWSVERKTNIFSRPVPVSVNRDGVPEFLVNALDHWCYMISGRDGSILWQRAVGNTDQVVTGGGGISTPALADLNGDGLPECVVGSEDGAVYALSCRDGAVLWRTETGDKVASSPAMADLDRDGTPDCVIGSNDGQVYALSGRDGVVLWTRETGDPTDVAVLTTRMANGEVRTKRASGHPVFSSPSLSDLNGDGIPDVVIGTSADSILALSGRDGTVLWTHPTAGSVICCPALADLDGDGVADCVAGSTDGIVYALSGKEGSLLWSSQAGNCIHASAVLVDIDGDGVPDCLLGSVDSRLYALSGRDGAAIWTFETGDQIEASVATADMDGDHVVDFVFGSWDGMVYALRGRDPGVVARSLADWSRPAEAQARLVRHRLAKDWRALVDLSEECIRSTKDPWLRAVASAEEGTGQAHLGRYREALEAFAEARRLDLESRSAIVSEWFSALGWEGCPATRLAEARKALLDALSSDADGVFDAFVECADVGSGPRAALVFRDFLRQPSEDDGVQAVACSLLSLRLADGSRPGLAGGSAREAIAAARDRVRRHVASNDAPFARWLGYLALLGEALGEDAEFEKERKAFSDLSGRPASIEKVLDETAHRK